MIADSVSQVLHATPSIRSTLYNMRKLLAPRGRLFIQELAPSKVSLRENADQQLTGFSNEDV